jgi:DNA-directed RNA polymerase subunit RPC12/RpoP
MTGGIRVSLKCVNCGGTDFTMSERPAEREWIVCTTCGERLSTVGELDDEVVRLAHDAIRQHDAARGDRP